MLEHIVEFPIKVHIIYRIQEIVFTEMIGLKNRCILGQENGLILFIPLYCLW